MKDIDYKYLLQCVKKNNPPLKEYVIPLNEEPHSSMVCLALEANNFIKALFVVHDTTEPDLYCVYR